MSTEQATPEHTFKDLDKFGLFTDAPGEQNRRSHLVWSTFRGNPRITVFTGVQNDTEKGVIRAPMSPEVFLVMMEKLEEVIKAQPGTKFWIENFTSPKQEEGQRLPSTERILISTTYMGKDKDGMVWISVRAPKDRPTIVFKFQLSDYHKLYNGDGSPVTPDQCSCIVANAWRKGVIAAMEKYMGEERPPYDPETQGRNRNGGGFQRNGGGNSYGNKGGGQQPRKQFDDLDDIPL
jgi:hypothetical protein